MATISRVLPYQPWEIDAIEGWLDDMATQGLVFTHYSGGYYYFREDEPQTLRHRFDVHERIADHDRRHEEYRDFGWEHICYVDARTDIYRAAREDAVELNTDEETLRSVMEKSQRRLRNTLIFGELLGAVTLILLVVSICRFGFFRPFLTKSLWDLLPIPLWLFLVIFGDIRLWRSYREMKRRSLLERTYHTREREAARRRELRTDTVVRLLLLPILLLPLLADDYDPREHMEIADTGYTCYSLQEILPAESTVDEGYAMRYHHALSDEYYFPQNTASGKRCYVNVYEVHGAWLARCYAQEQARIADADSLEVAGHESAWFYRGTPISMRHYLDTPDTQNLILLQDNLVVEIEYTGPSDLKSAVQN
ncbi:MAG: DUF2812 domain-containing protein [Clostridia bacterium]|nr:DUF2812 domain-containing protein [Clostridia bacterium]